ncbi:hypothetical protein QL285_037492 [Trifolium repens]|jgi:hypothetical protein|nr:hypothetical protein QL285_037492 [Trifolium repens]
MGYIQEMKDALYTRIDFGLELSGTTMWGMTRVVPHASGRGSPIFNVCHDCVRLVIGHDRLQSCDLWFFFPSMQSVTAPRVIIHEINTFPFIFS